MTDSLKLFLGNKQVLVETNEIPISNNAEETFNDTDTKQSDINKTFKKEIENKQKNLVNTDNTISFVDNVDTNNVDISVNIPESEKIITKTQEGLTTNISLNFNNNELQLKGKDNQLISSTEIISSIVYRGVFNDIASAKYILADTLANKDIILVIIDNQYYQYNATDNIFVVVNDVNIINSLKNKQDTLSNTDSVKIENNISALKDETGNDITDAEGNVIKEVKKNIVIKKQDNSSDVKFLGLYKDNTSIENYKNGDIIYNNNISNYQSFNEKTSSWENYNDLRTLQSIKALQTAIRIPENSPLQFSKRLKEGSTVELEEVLTASFTRWRYDLEYKTYDEVVALPKAQKHNGDIFKLKDNSILLYVCEPTVDENYNVIETETYHYIRDNRKTTFTPKDYLKPYNIQWTLNFSNDFGVWMKNNRVECNGYIAIQTHPSIIGGFNNIFKIDTSKFKEGWIVDSSEFVNEKIRRDSNIILLTNNTYYSCTYTMNIIDNKGVVTIKIYFTAAVANSMNTYNGGFNFCNFYIPLTKA